MARMRMPATHPDDPAVTPKQAKAWAKQHGIHGEVGGWLRTGDGYPLAQGWEALMRFLATSSRAYRRDVDSLSVGQVIALRERVSEHRA